ncbi:MAG: hypothetical protein IKQ56_07250 [Lachnospiraceae bacterium]|nr:hypothetical protein [Lachnospiraceae bacterium]
MKIFNIENTEKLFGTLSECEGSEELVNKNGEHIVLTDGKNSNLNILSETYVNGTIKEMELSFENEHDVLKVLEFLTRFHNAA